METTNLEKVKGILKYFASLTPEPIDQMMVYHPFLQTKWVLNKEKEMVDVFEKEEYFDHYVDVIQGLIDKTDDLGQIFIHITKSFKLTTFKYICEYLSDKDYGEVLKDCWTMEEYTSKNPHLTKKEMVSLFKKAKKEYIMNDEELEVYNNLPDMVTIYRGVRDKKWLRGLSWTLSYEQAEWFATRFDSETSIVYEVTLPKKEIITYINDRNEDEVIIDPYNLKKYEIKEIVL